MKNIYGELNKVTVDAELNNEPLDELSQQQYYQQFKKSTVPVKKKNRKLTGYIAAAAIAISALTFTNEDVQAGVESILDKVTYSLSNELTPEAANYGTDVNETISLDEADVKLTDFFIDDKYLTYNLLVTPTGNKDQDAYNNITLYHVKLNGKNIATGSFGGAQVIDKKKNITSETSTVSLSQELPKENVTLELEFKKVDGKGESAIYKVKTNSEKLSQATKTFAASDTIKFDNATFSIDKLVVNPLTSRLFVKYQGDKVYDAHVIDEHGHDYYFNSNDIQSGEHTAAMMTFNPDFSKGTIEQLNKAKSFKVYFIGYENQGNGDRGKESKSSPLHITPQ